MGDSEIELQDWVTKKLGVYIIVGIIVAFFFYATYFKGSFDEDFKKSYQLKILKFHLEDNNLKILDDNPLQIVNGWESDKDLYEWYSFLQENYHYDPILFNCKYWSLVWALYFEKHRVEYKFITTHNHIFVMADYKDKYCFADEDLLTCFNINESG